MGDQQPSTVWVKVQRPSKTHYKVEVSRVGAKWLPSARISIMDIRYGLNVYGDIESWSNEPA
ncbi:hypothetical protein JMM81_01895 [Bacillus sp. V3B]|uniref:hypothetical protein n=1 Tax=Bacillus sp. V3B TaxID=2804915 RepID=UPI00210D5066|nr:hypothetical protein [Bacillus sp. V3B]MCQ6273729.1 hypothetical protein [Bacillus sp. V3B]